MHTPLNIRLNLLNSRYPIQLHLMKPSNKLNTVPNDLNILHRHPQPPRPTNMPMRLRLQILAHNRRQHHQLRIQIIQHLPIRQEQPVGNLLRHPREILMRREQVQRPRRIPPIQLLKPAHRTLVVDPVALPSFTRERVIPVLLLLDAADGEDGFDGLADADEGDGFEESFAETAGEVLAGLGGAVGGL